MALIETPQTSRGKFGNDIGSIRKPYVNFDSDGVFRTNSYLMISAQSFKRKLYYAVNEC